jgi:prepilin-type N-terminal cleavage/methylation domain-containing protein
MTHQKPTKLLKGFTLVEVLIVVAIIAVLTIAILLVLNPMEYLKQSRDAVRLQDIGNLFKTLNYIKADSPQTYFGESNKVYVSLPDPNINSGTSTCSGINLPSLPNGWQYQCVSKNTLQNIDGTGWIPVDFTRQSIFRLNKLPIDPKNDLDNYYVYTYDPQSDKFELGSILESEKYQNLASNDNGDNPNIYESGTNLSLYPISSIGGNFALKNESNQSVKNESNSLIYVAQAASNGQVTFFIGSDQATGDNNLYWDNTNKMLGIGTASPAQTLHVQGNAYFSGNVGIGITTPSEKLSINPPSNQRADIGLRSTGGAGSAILMGEGGSYNAMIGYHQGIAGGLEFRTGGIGSTSNTRIAITSSGNVGIGTTNPTKKLVVAGDVYLSGSGTFSSNATDAHLYFGGSERTGSTGGTNFYYANGYYSPRYAHRFMTGSSNSSLARVVSIEGSYPGAVQLAVQGANSQSADLQQWLNSSGSVLAVVTASGNVGIGTTTPAYKLDVSGDIRTTGCLVYNGGTLGTCASDINLKNIISSFKIDNALDKIIKLNPVKYTFKKDPSGQILIGLIAQEVEQFAPEFVTQTEEGKQIKYGDLQWLQIEAIKELKKENDELKKENYEIKLKINNLEEEIKALKNN